MEKIEEEALVLSDYNEENEVYTSTATGPKKKRKITELEIHAKEYGYELCDVTYYDDEIVWKGELPLYLMMDEEIDKKNESTLNAKPEDFLTEKGYDANKLANYILSHNTATDSLRQ